MKRDSGSNHSNIKILDTSTKIINIYKGGADDSRKVGINSNLAKTDQKLLMASTPVNFNSGNLSP